MLPVQSPRGDRKGLLSPKRKSDTSAFQAFMTPQKHSGGHLVLLLHKEIMPLTAGFALTVPGFLSLLHTSQFACCLCQYHYTGEQAASTTPHPASIASWQPFSLLIRPLSVQMQQQSSTLCHMPSASQMRLPATSRAAQLCQTF